MENKYWVTYTRASSDPVDVAQSLELKLNSIYSHLEPGDMLSWEKCRGGGNTTYFLIIVELDDAEEENEEDGNARAI